MKSSVIFAVVMCVVAACGGGVAPELETPDIFAPAQSEQALAASSLVYHDSLQNGFADWSWTPHNLASTAPVAQGTRAISATFKAWKGLQFHRNTALNTAGLSQLVVLVHGGSAYDGARIAVRAVSGKTWSSGVPIGPYCDGGKIRARTWVTCRIPLSAFGADNRNINTIVFQEWAGRKYSSSMSFDEIELRPQILADAGTPPPPPPPPPPPSDAGTVDAGTVDAGTPPPPPPPPPADSGTVDAGTPPPPPPGSIIEPGNPGTVDVQLSVRADSDVKPISPYIYGTNFNDDIATTKQAIVRIGGNRWTAYNWENNASNAGVDYCYQNDSFLGGGEIPGEVVRSRVSTSNANGAASIITVPLVDYVAADKNGGCDVRNSGSNYLDTRFRKNRATKGSALSLSPDKSDAFVYQDEFVNWTKQAVPGAQLLYSLDNEPDLWSDTHPEVHPASVGYDELCTRNINFATAIKSVSPLAKVLGFVSYGWWGFVTLQDAPDRSGKGEFVDYYLTRMKQAEASAGKRLIDYLDLHWYPEAKGGGVRVIGTSTAADVVEARVQAPRSLWDETYTETSWVASNVGGPIKLIPRMQSKIAASYPGTGLAMTEWNYGGGQHISGAIATADVLGILGKYGVGVANLWWLNSNESYTLGAVQAYRNFDGAGARFGDTSIRATTGDRAAASVHASVDSTNPNRVVIVAINKRATSRVAGLTIAHSKLFRTARVYTITSSGGARPHAAAGISTVANNAFRYTMPAQSVSIIVPEP